MLEERVALGKRSRSEQKCWAQESQGKPPEATARLVGGEGGHGLVPLEEQKSQAAT